MKLPEGTLGLYCLCHINRVGDSKSLPCSKSSLVKKKLFEQEKSSLDKKRLFEQEKALSAKEKFFGREKALWTASAYTTLRTGL